MITFVPHLLQRNKTPKNGFSVLPASFGSRFLLVADFHIFYTKGMKQKGNTLRR
jgi:hypothetical protein